VLYFGVYTLRCGVDRRPRFSFKIYIICTFSVIKLVFNVTQLIYSASCPERSFLAKIFCRCVFINLFPFGLLSFPQYFLSFYCFFFNSLCCSLLDIKYKNVCLSDANISAVIQGFSKRSIHFQKFILQQLLTLNPCPVYGWKGNLSKFWYRWSEAARHWGCSCCCLWHAATSVGKAGLSILRLPRHTGAHIECL
jgi:hypothetical protein